MNKTEFSAYRVCPAVFGSFPKTVFFRSPNKDAGFTRIELLAIIGALVLLAAPALPLLAGTRTRSERAICVNNLRQIGQAFQAWASDHGDKKPWMVNTSEGGTAEGPQITIPGFPPGSNTIASGLRPNVWVPYLVMNRELGTPEILVCPSDARARRAIAWDNSPGGLMDQQRMNLAVSYTIGLHSRVSSPRAVLSSDRNIATDRLTDGCIYNMGITSQVFLNTPTNAKWDSSLHNLSGNVLFNDGTVEQLSTPSLKQALLNNGEHDNESLHFLTP